MIVIPRKQSPQAEEVMAQLIESSIAQLLSTKHIYQNIEIDLSRIKKLGDEKHTPEKLEYEFRLRPWLPASKNTGYTQRERLITSTAMSGTQPTETALNDLNVLFTIPTIETSCAKCGKFVHHDSIPYLASSPYHLNPEAVKEPRGCQTFVFDFQCVACKGAPLKFIVTRTFNKIQLCGRSKVLEIPPPEFIPKKLRLIYSEAVASANCGDIYAGFYHLRTLLEHHMKTSCSIEMSEYIEGDLLCSKYYETLNEAVARKAAVTNELKTCSKNLHARVGSFEEFTTVLKKVESHFKFIDSIKDLE